NGTLEMSRERPKISTPTDNSLSQIALPSPLLAPVTIIISCRPFATEIPLPASQQSETCFATSTSPFPKSSQTQSPASPQYLQATSKAPTISSSPRRDRRQSTECPQTRASCFQAARSLHRRPYSLFRHCRTWWHLYGPEAAPWGNSCYHSSG